MGCIEERNANNNVRKEITFVTYRLQYPIIENKKVYKSRQIKKKCYQLEVEV